MFTICSRHRPSRRSPGRRSDGPGHGPVKPESTGFGPIPGKTRGFLADTGNARKGQMEAALRRVRPERWEELMGPAARELLRKYTPVVLARERAEALEEGKARGRAETFLRQARVRFGHVPESRARQVMAADAAALDRWLEALLAADSLEAVFGTTH